MTSRFVSPVLVLVLVLVLAVASRCGYRPTTTERFVHTDPKRENVIVWRFETSASQWRAVSLFWRRAFYGTRELLFACGQPGTYPLRGRRGSVRVTERTTMKTVGQFTMVDKISVNVTLSMIIAHEDASDFIGYFTTNVAMIEAPVVTVAYEIVCRAYPHACQTVVVCESVSDGLFVRNSTASWWYKPEGSTTYQQIVTLVLAKNQSAASVKIDDRTRASFHQLGTGPVHLLELSSTDSGVISFDLDFDGEHHQLSDAVYLPPYRPGCTLDEIRVERFRRLF